MRICFILINDFVENVLREILSFVSEKISGLGIQLFCCKDTSFLQKIFLAFQFYGVTPITCTIDFTCALGSTIVLSDIIMKVVHIK